MRVGVVKEIKKDEYRVALTPAGARELVLHGRETGRLVMMPHGEFVEVHEPISPEKAWLLTQHEQNPPLALEESDLRGVRRPGVLKNKLRARMSKAHAVSIPKATAEDLKEIEHH